MSIKWVDVSDSWSELSTMVSRKRREKSSRKKDRGNENRNMKNEGLYDRQCDRQTDRQTGSDICTNLFCLLFVSFSSNLKIAQVMCVY